MKENKGPHTKHLLCVLYLAGYKSLDKALKNITDEEVRKKLKRVWAQEHGTDY